MTYKCIVKERGLWFRRFIGFFKENEAGNVVKVNGQSYPVFSRGSYKLQESLRLSCILKRFRDVRDLLRLCLNFKIKINNKQLIEINHFKSIGAIKFYLGVFIVLL